MLTLIVVGLLGGVVTSLSPCVLPVLPVILAAGTSRRADGPAPADASAPAPKSKQSVPRSASAVAAAKKKAAKPAPASRSLGGSHSWRPYGVVAGLVISFSLSTLFGSIVLSALHLPQDLLRDAGIVVLVIIGLSLIVPKLADLIERPFARLSRGRAVNPDSNGLVLGLGLGLLFVPCAGPVLATIAVVGASHHIGVGALVLTLAFGIGVGIPLLILALAGDALSRKVGVLRSRAKGFRLASGVAMVLVAAAIGFNLTDGLQRHVPGYTNAIQKNFQNNSQLRDLTSNGSGVGQKVAKQDDSEPKADAAGDTSCREGANVLVACGPAPGFTGINGWLNTDGDKSLSLKGLRGKVVLIDFWTYSCINCQRTLPFLENWYKSYHSDGLEIVGVHTPEFAFEHVTSNIREQAASLGVKYPIAIDNDYGTWNAYGNQYWPAEYLIDATGNIRHVSFGEGGYADTEKLIRQLLADAKPHTSLAPKTDTRVDAPAPEQTPETYLGYARPQNVSGTKPAADKTTTYTFPSKIADDTFALSGTWNVGKQAATAGADAELKLSYQSSKVFLVLGGKGSVQVTVPGRTTRTVPISGVPRLYTLINDENPRKTILTLRMSPGVQAYAFTFG